MAVRRFDEGDFVTNLTRKGGLDQLQAEIIGKGLGDLASEMRDGQVAVLGAIHQLDDRVSGLERRLDGVESRLDGMERKLDVMLELLLAWNDIAGPLDSGKVRAALSGEPSPEG